MTPAQEVSAFGHAIVRGGLAALIVVVAAFGGVVGPLDPAQQSTGWSLEVEGGGQRALTQVVPGDAIVLAWKESCAVLFVSPRQGPRRSLLVVGAEETVTLRLRGWQTRRLTLGSSRLPQRIHVTVKRGIG